MSKTYDRAYFDHWYRKRRIRVRSALARKAQMVVALTEFFTETSLRSVLDVGCGEAPWRAEILQLRPKASYVGVDPSDYVVEAFGKSHNLRKGGFGELASLGLEGPFDLVVCSDVLHYVPEEQIKSGLVALHDLLGGVAFLDTLTIEDEPVGDLEGFHPRSASWYRRVFRAAGLVACGPQSWVLDEVREASAALETITK